VTRSRVIPGGHADVTSGDADDENASAGDGVSGAADDVRGVIRTVGGLGVLVTNGYDFGDATRMEAGNVFEIEVVHGHHLVWRYPPTTTCFSS
jgi:hypothetical protein